MKWDNYIPIQSFECLNSCIVGYMNNIEKKIKPEEVFFIGSGYRLMLSKEDIPTIGAELYESNFRFLNYCDIGYTNACVQGRQNAIEFLSESINNGQMISVKVSSELLIHNRVFTQTEGSPHYINILDENANEYLIADGYVPTLDPSTYVGYVEKKAIIDAWEKMDFKYFIGEYQNYTKEDGDIKKASFISFMAFLDSFISNNAGKSMFDEVFDYIQALFDRGEDCNVIKSTLVAINYHLKIYGFITTKRYSLNMIRQVVEESSLVEQYENIITKWNKLCMSLLKVGYSAKQDKFDKVKNKIYELLREESNILIEIKDAARMKGN